MKIFLSFIASVGVFVGWVAVVGKQHVFLLYVGLVILVVAWITIFNMLKKVQCRAKNLLSKF